MKITVWYLLVIWLIKVKEMVNYIFAHFSCNFFWLKGRFRKLFSLLECMASDQKTSKVVLNSYIQYFTTEWQMLARHIFRTNFLNMFLNFHRQEIFMTCAAEFSLMLWHKCEPFFCHICSVHWDIRNIIYAVSIGISS